MSPKPEILKPEYLQGIEGPAMVTTVTLVQQLLDTPEYIKSGPQNAVIDKRMPVMLSGEILFRGTNLIEFTSRIIHQGLLPFNPNTPHNPILLHKGFGVDTSFNKKTGYLTVTRTGKSDLSVRISSPGFPNPFHLAVMEAVAALAVIQDEYWGAIRDNGVIVGNLLGDYYDKTWDIESFKRAILLPDFDDPSKTPPLTPMNTSVLGGMIRDHMEKRIQNSASKRLVEYHPVAILADLRTEN